MNPVTTQVEKAMQEAFKLPVKVRWADPHANPEAYAKIMEALKNPEKEDE